MFWELYFEALSLCTFAIQCNKITFFHTVTVVFGLLILARAWEGVDLPVCVCVSVSSVGVVWVLVK